MLSSAPELKAGVIIITWGKEAENALHLSDNRAVGEEFGISAERRGIDGVGLKETRAAALLGRNRGVASVSSREEARVTADGYSGPLPTGDVSPGSQWVHGTTSSTKPYIYTYISHTDIYLSNDKV